MRVKDVMTKSPYVCGPDDSLEDAARLMEKHGCGCVPVLGGDEHVIGILTDRDVCLAAYRERRLLDAMQIAPYMSSKVLSCGPDDTLEDAAERMRNHRIHRLVVVDPAGKLLGIVSLDDLAQRGASRLHADGDGLSDGDIARTLAAAQEPRSYGP
jgi:CBS domain-containing protein